MGPTKAASGAAVRAHMPSRRLVLRTALTVGVTAGTAGALAPVLARPPEGETSGPELERFDETYRGRSIQGAATATGPASGTGGAAAPAGRAAAGAVAAQPDIAVRIDGRPLHVMRRADGSYLSTVNHYESFPTLLETARAAVDELGSARLSTAFAHSI